MNENLQKGRDGVKPRLNNDIIEKCIEGTSGIVTIIQKKIINETGYKYHWHTIKKKIFEDEDLKRLYDNEIQITIDIAENVIRKALNNNDVQTAKWYLLIKGNERGYIEKQHHHHTGAVGQYDLELSDEEQNTIAESLGLLKNE